MAELTVGAQLTAMMEDVQRFNRSTWSIKPQELSLFSLVWPLLPLLPPTPPTLVRYNSNLHFKHYCKVIILQDIITKINTFSFFTSNQSLIQLPDPEIQENKKTEHMC